MGLTSNGVSVKGEVKDTDGKMEEKTIHFAVRPDTRILCDGKESALKDIRPDDPIQITFTQKAGSTLRQVSQIHAGRLPEPTQTAELVKKKGAGKKKK